MAWLSRVSGFVRSRQVTLVVTGLPHSGKTTLMKQLQPAITKLNVLTPSIPMGFDAEKFTYKTITIVNFDLGDKNCFGNPWEDFYRGCHALIFVVDGSDRYHMEPARIELHKMLLNPLVYNYDVPLLVLVNKSENPDALPALQVTELLELNSITDKQWKLFSIDGLTGEGLSESLDWLSHQLRSRIPDSARVKTRKTVKINVNF